MSDNKKGCIRIRHSDKSITTLPDDAIFVELVDNEGKVVAVLSQDPNLSSAFTLFNGTDKDLSDRYSKYFGVEFVGKVVDLPLDKFLKI